jgi:hypothetical protein
MVRIRETGVKMGRVRKKKRGTSEEIKKMKSKACNEKGGQ